MKDEPSFTGLGCCVDTGQADAATALGCSQAARRRWTRKQGLPVMGEAARRALWEQRGGR